MQNAIGQWERVTNEPALYCPLIASSPPPAALDSTQYKNFLSASQFVEAAATAGSGVGSYNPFETATAAASFGSFTTANTSLNTQSQFSTPISATTYAEQPNFAQSQLIAATTTNPFTSSSSTTAAGSNLTDYLRNIVALNNNNQNNNSLAETLPAPTTTTNAVTDDLSKALVAALQQQQNATPLTTTSLATGQPPPSSSYNFNCAAAAVTTQQQQNAQALATATSTSELVATLLDQHRRNSISQQQRSSSFGGGGDGQQAARIQALLNQQQSGRGATTTEGSSATASHVDSSPSASDPSNSSSFAQATVINAAALAAAQLLNTGQQLSQPSTPQSNPQSASLLGVKLDSFLSSIQQQNQQLTDSSPSSSAAALNNNPFLVTPQQQQAPPQSSAFKFVGSPQQPSQQNLFNSADSNSIAAANSLILQQAAAAVVMLSSPQMRGCAGGDLSSMVATKKPIPLSGPIDLASFRIRDPYKWTTDDVVAWILDVARRHNIPREEIGVIEFGSHTGLSLTCMSEQAFKEINPRYGSLLHGELRRMLNDEPLNSIDDLIRYCRNGEQPDSSHMDDESHPSTSRGPNPNLLNPIGSQSFGHLLSANSPLSPLALHHQQQQQQQQNGMQMAGAQSNAPLMHSPIANAIQQQFHQHHQQQQQQQQNEANLQKLFAATHSQLVAQQQTLINQQNQQIFHQAQQQLLHQQQHQQKHSPSAVRLAGLGSAMPGPSSCNGFEATTVGGLDEYGQNGGMLGGGKIRKNKDGKPRKRSQHTKGNKLWEFIRDALKDPNTCPTIVRWEDPEQGVFRIVESEKLARLWGDKKNNQKMTYEKLSRAMRTYYEKQILVPVPKTGLYPKKLVYKFGPGARDWTAPPQLVHACLKLQQNDQH